ncbi:MAG: Hsp70 family protein, partial [Planctomycetota bacterium]
GTFDVSLLESAGRSFRTLGTDGDVRLGGQDFDERLVDHVAAQFVDTHGVDPRTDWQARHALLVLCRRMKHHLSEHQTATGEYEFAGCRLDVKVGRLELEQMIEPLIDRTLTTCDELLREANITWPEIDDVLLVGGSSRVPFVAECLEAKTGKKPQLVSEPEQAVARGAAIYAATQTGDDLPPLKVVNVNAHSLGVPGVDVQTGKKINRILIPRNTPLPASATRRYVTKREDQRSVVVSLLEGESENPHHCTRMANCIAQLEPGLPARTEVVVTCRYDSNGTVSATAVVPATRARAHVEVQREGMVELDPLDVWAAKLARGEVAAPFAKAPSSHLSGRASAWQGPKRLLREVDDLHAKLGEACAALALPEPAEPARQALLSAESELDATRELHRLVTEKLRHEQDQRPRIKLQSDATLLGMYTRQTEAAVRRLRVALGDQCAEVDFFPDQASVSREMLRTRKEALEAMLAASE